LSIRKVFQGDDDDGIDDEQYMTNPSTQQDAKC